MEFVKTEQIQGATIRDGMPCYEVNGRFFNIVGALRRGNGFVPVLDIPMADEKPKTGEGAAS